MPDYGMWTKNVVEKTYQKVKQQPKKSNNGPNEVQ